MEVLHELVAFFAIYGYIAVFFVLIACGFGIPIPEDITLVSGGVICGLVSTLDVHIMIIVSLGGVLMGDGTMFTLGKILGPRVKKVPILKRVFTEKSYKQMQEKVHKYGSRILFVARFLPGLRAPIFVTAGISRRVSYLKFLLLDGSAALISVPIWVYAGYYFAHDLDDLIHWVRHSETLVISALVIIAAIWLLISIFRSRKSNKQ